MHRMPILAIFRFSKPNCSTNMTTWAKKVWIFFTPDANKIRVKSNRSKWRKHCCFKCVYQNFARAQHLMLNISFMRGHGFHFLFNNAVRQCKYKSYVIWFIFICIFDRFAKIEGACNQTFRQISEKVRSVDHTNQTNDASDALQFIFGWKA